MNTFHKRQGQMDLAQCYFYTDTIYNFKHLLADDALKQIIIDFLYRWVSSPTEKKVYLNYEHIS
jgi:hypothetical protein